MLSHSLGNFVAVEALRQMAIRHHGLSGKIKDIMLASPDIDVDVFRRQIAEIELDDKQPPVTLFVSQDDRALGLSKLLAGDEPRLGAVDPTVEPYRGVLERAHVRVIDLTTLAADDPTNHSKFAGGDVVRQIGLRLATGQPLNDAKSNFGESVGIFAVNAADAMGKATATVVTAPFVVDDSGKSTPLPGDPVLAKGR
jgi:esterase/lipase superfamily enzyme